MECADAALVLAKIQASGARRETELDDQFSFWFSIELRGRRRYFFIPTPLFGTGYTEYQLETIETELIKFDIDLLPLDHHLLQ
jgi:hypothetical protein